MPIVLTVTEKLTSCWVLPKGVKLLAPEDNRMPGPDKPWSWRTYNHVLTYWDDKGNKHKRNGDVEQELEDEEFSECDYMDSDTESESESDSE